MTGTKAEISKVFRGMEKLPIEVMVFSFGSKTRLGQGVKGFVDIVVISSDWVAFIEVKTKLTNDRFSPPQVLMRMLLEMLADKTDFVKYEVITTLKEALDLREQLINNRG